MTTPPIDALRTSLSGQVVSPEQTDWDEAPRAWNLAVDQRPSAVAFPESATDVQATVRLRGTTACGSPHRGPATTRARSPRSTTPCSYGRCA